MAVEQAEQAQQKQQANKLSVVISYNGMEPSFDYNPEQAAAAIHAKALNHYDIRGAERQRVFLFGPDNQTEISNTASMGSQVEPGSRLYLRRRSAGGG